MALPQETVPLRFTILHSDLLVNGARREVLIYDENAPPGQRVEGFYDVTLADPVTLTLPVAEALKLAERKGSHVIMEFRQVNWQKENQEFD